MKTEGASTPAQFGFYDFFAGGGMAGIGLGKGWKCLMANDFSEKKAMSYRENFHPARELIVKDVHDLTTADMPGSPIMAWASFPCQDLSVAGARRGLEGNRSGSYWGFRRIVKELRDEGRALPILVLENVVGAVTAKGGADFTALMESLVALDYYVGPIIADAAHFVPQSRPRLFIVAVRRGLAVEKELRSEGPAAAWHTARLTEARARQNEAVRNAWVWWRLPKPPTLDIRLRDVIEDDPPDAPWRTPDATQRLLDSMAPRHLDKIRAAQASGKPEYGTVFRRVRQDKAGGRVQRAEVRFDGISGCLRTSGGGSSRQFLIAVEGEKVRSRFLSVRECARLMGLPESYALPKVGGAAHHLIGDGLVVPVVSWIEEHLLRPLAVRARADSVESTAGLNASPH
ncbi:MAG: DNA cytosine methyltransferase [Syntrophobacteraceae bacterium]